MANKRISAGLAAVALVLATGLVVARPASAAPMNSCLASGKLVHPASNNDYAAFRYMGSGDSCGVMSIELMAYRVDGPSGATYYTFKQVPNPYIGAIYQTAKNVNSTSARGCSWNGVSPLLHCEKADVSWEFSNPFTWTSFNQWWG